MRTDIDSVSDLYFRAVLPSYIRLATKQAIESDRNRVVQDLFGSVINVMPTFDVEREETTAFEVEGNTFLEILRSRRIVRHP